MLAMNTKAATVSRPREEVTKDTGERALKRDRLFMGLGYVLHHSEENAIGAIPAKIIRTLGGDDRHIGIYGMSGGIASMAQFLGAFLLRWKQSNRRAMIFTMFLGALFAGLVAFVLVNFGAGTTTLILFLALALLFCATGGIQLNIESGWIGDLVPKKVLGWFTSFKWGLSVASMMVFSLVLAKIGDTYSTLAGYGCVYILFAVSFLAAALFIYPRVTDREPKCVNYFAASTTTGGRLNYRSPVFWCYIGYFAAWCVGRGMLYSFSAIYLIEYFKLKLVSIAWLNNIQSLTSIVMLLLAGKITDRFGSRIPLLLVTGIIALSMVLYAASAWWGIPAIMVYLVINGIAGQTHSMLIVNYGLEIFPEKGRASYLGFSRLMTGAGSVTGPAIAAAIAHHLKDFHVQLWGAELIRYHVVFLTGACVVALGIIPLLIAGRRKVVEPAAISI